MTAPDDSTDELDDALAEARRQFVVAFDPRAREMAQLIDTIAATFDTSATDTLFSLAHRTAGLAGVLGFAQVTEHAAALEDVALGAQEGRFDAVEARAALARMRAAFAAAIAGGSEMQDPPR